MYSKLSFNNVKRSIKDYAIYFFTIAFAVCIFYIFNSIKSQSVMLDINNEQKSIFDAIDNIMGKASIFIAFVIGFLIIYSNNYLIKRRNKEFGLYLLLGMEKRKLGIILFMETLLIGILSLALGLGLGVILSQALSIITGKLFEADVTKFQFVFSSSACIKTIISFCIMYVIVFIFNNRTIKKVKLIDLFNSLKKNDKNKINNLWVSVGIFILSIGLIGYGYYIVIDKGIAVINGELGIAVLSGAVGTVLFFMSLSGFLLKLISSNKGIYLRKLNMFTLRQINSKINSTFISVSLICLMLFISICSLASGISMCTNINKNLRDLSPHDFSLWSYNQANMEKILKDNNFEFDKYCDNWNYFEDYVDTNFTFDKLFNNINTEDLKNYFVVANNETVPVMKLSEFNKEMQSIGKEAIALKYNEYAILTDIDDAHKYLKEVQDNKTSLEINGKKLIPSKDKYIENTLINETMKNNVCTVIVSDNICDKLQVRNTYMNMTLKNKDENEKEEIKKQLDSIKNKDSKYDFYGISDIGVRASIQGVGVMIAYIAIYLGIVFLVCAAVTIAIKQLSEAEDNKFRYDLLRKIGVDNNSINKCLLNQIGIYFLIPLVLAIIHSFVGLRIAKDIVSLFSSGVSLTTLILISLIFIVVVYGAYFITTYLCAKNTIKEGIKIS
ncbi:MAG: FtsX-like permease family protein [Clostridiaceae bacterium]|nr:FtsX-like permease family protein [Clostridiaceae bacterium]